MPTKFDPETRFELRPAPPAPFRAASGNRVRAAQKPAARGAIGARQRTGVERSAAARGQRGGGTGLGDILSPAGVPGVVRGKNPGCPPPGRTPGAHLREQPRTARRMNSLHDDNAQAESRQLEVGTRACRVEAVWPRRRACASGRLHGRKNSDARANGFSPRLFGFVGKTSERGRLVCVGVQASACLNEQAKA